jgi:hypothetical protein
VVIDVEWLREPMQMITDRFKALCGIDQIEGMNVVRLDRNT